MIRDVNIPGVAQTKGFTRIDALIRGYVPAYTQAGKKLTLQIADAYLWDLKTLVSKYNIMGPSARARARRPATLEIYRRQGFRNTRTLVRTGAYLKGLRVRREWENQFAVQAAVGAHAQDVHTPSGLTMARLANILEHGNPNNLVFGRVLGPIRARPHHRPAWKKFKRTKLQAMVTRGAKRFVERFWTN